MRLPIDPFPELHTERLHLREPNREDCNAILTLRSDPEVTRYIRREKAKSIREAMAFLEKITIGYRNGKNVNWAISLDDNPAMIGSICLWNFSEDRLTAEIGYDLLPAFHGQGIMGEAMRKVLAFGFETLGLLSIEAFTHQDNIASLRLLSRHGFTMQTGRSDPEDPDNVILTLRAAGS